MSPTRSSTEWRCCAVEPRERLKRYLEQRRELGERELVLDGMTVEDVMKIVGAAGRAPRAASAGASEGRAEPSEPSATPSPARADAPPRAIPDPTDWREALRASGVDAASGPAPVSKRYEFPRPVDTTAPLPVEPARDAPASD